jgi:hypothetical protein
MKGWGVCSSTRAERYRTNFAHGAAALRLVSTGMQARWVAEGNVYGCDVGLQRESTTAFYILNATAAASTAAVAGRRFRWTGRAG